MPVLVITKKRDLVTIPAFHKSSISPQKEEVLYEQNKNRYRRASLTAEAAMALPLFLFTLFCFWQCFLLLLMQLSVCSKVAETTLSSASFGYLERSVKEDVLARLYRPLFLNSLAEQERAEGMRIFLKETEEGKIQGTVTYLFCCNVPFLGNIEVPMTQSFCFLPYVGVDREDRFAQGAEEKEEVVYVTASGRVYHVSKSCVYLSVSVSGIAKEDIPMKRNTYGQGYSACSRCMSEEEKEQYFISAGGTKYHTTATCPALKRIVEEKRREEVSLPACSKCGKGKEE